jgi:pimeloyl-ACP methyl ester carboxylesterase
MTPAKVSANGIEFAYLEQGKGPLVLLVHGFPDTAHTWDRVMPAVAEAGFRAVAPFTRGYWPTEAKGPYDSDTLGADIVALIEALGEQQAIVVGHDWGASAAFCAAGSRPDRVRMLITLAIPHPKSLKPSPLLVWKIRHFFTLGRASGPAKARANNFAYIDELWRRWSPAWKDLPASETAAVKESFSHDGALEAACAYYAASNPRKRPKGHRPNIAMPSVAFAGTDDMIAPRAFEKARHCYDASYEVIQVPGGHFMHREHPDEFITELVRTLKQHGQ